MNKKLNPDEAPPGYVAVAASGCKGCAFDAEPDCSDSRAGVGCCRGVRRKDGHSVIFVKHPEPVALDARYTLRLPAATKAKAQRIGGAAVIAAIEAVQEGGAA